MPGKDIGLAIILLTVLVKMALYPLTKKSIESQTAMARMQPELDRIKKEFPDKQEQAKRTMELYKEQKTSPFSGCLVMLIQLPIIFALYYVFLSGFTGSMDLLYPFVKNPGSLNTVFLGFLDISKPHIVLAILAGISQFAQMKISFSAPKTPAAEGMPDMSKMMQTQMQYILPLLIIFIGTRLSGAVALYWITSNIVGAIQEYYIRKKLHPIHLSLY
jgi:YidC/Oxa1 family membrane protein insertase